jgi:hypothetical protein
VRLFIVKLAKECIHTQVVKYGQLVAGVFEDDSCLGSGVEANLYAPKRIGNIIPRYLAGYDFNLQNFISKKIPWSICLDLLRHCINNLGSCFCLGSCG